MLPLLRRVAHKSGRAALPLLPLFTMRAGLLADSYGWLTAVGAVRCAPAEPSAREACAGRVGAREKVGADVAALPFLAGFEGSHMIFSRAYAPA